MSRFIDWLMCLGKRKPIPGEDWEIIPEDDDPFPPKTKLPPVRVLGVRDGWVRYSIGHSFPDERVRMGIFLRFYRKAVQP